MIYIKFIYRTVCTNTYITYINVYVYKCVYRYKYVISFSIFPCNQGENNPNTLF